jgi:adenosylcobalamin-dependent ribonucleoside-diphosphate reductase
MLSDTRPPKVGKWTEPALRVLRERYLNRRGDDILETPEEMAWRVAQAIAKGEERWGRSPAAVQEIAAAFYDMMVEGYFLPNSPTLMNAGKGNMLQYSACYVLPIGDSMEEIFDAVKAAAIIHKSGGGTGFAFSRLRPKDDFVASTGGKASGPVSFLRVFNGATEAVKQGGTRRGANMGILKVDHPDILEFIECKLDGGITNFNISVAATDRFMEALEKGEEYELINPHTGAVAGTLSAREVFERIVRAAWRTGDPGMIFIDRINRSPANPTPEVGMVEATNPCGEQPLLPNEACNLGSLNVSKFSMETPGGEWTINWEELERVVRLSVRFLDDVIEMNPYPLPEIDETVKSNRRIGLGIMGWADLLFIMGIPYDSQEALDLAERIMAFVKEKSHDQSAKLAEERGPFPNWSRSIYKNDRPLRNSTVTTIAPTGCVGAETRIATAGGLLPIRQMGDPAGEQWQPIDAMVFTDTGKKAATQFYVNGRSPVITVRTARGYSLTATPNHKIRVIDRNGEYAWRRMDAIQIGDAVVLQREFLPHSVPFFLDGEPPAHGNEKPISLPGRLTPELCEFLGIYFGDGCTKEKGLSITFDERDFDTAEHVRVLVKSLFGLETGAVEHYDGCFALTVHSTRLVKWLDRNGLLKPHSSEIRVPEKIFQADRECVKAFLRGLFTADGAVSRKQGTLTLASVSEAFIDAVQLLLLGVGVVCKKDVSTNRRSAKGNLPLHRLTVLGRTAFAEISFLPGRKRDRFKALSPDRELMFRLPHAATLISEIYQRIPQGRLKATLRQAKHRGTLSMSLLRKLAIEHPEALRGSKLERFSEMSQFYDPVTSILFGEADTLDLSVPDTNTYIANGFVSHNTISMIAGCSSGIEPIFALAFEHRVKQSDGERVLPFINEVFERVAKVRGFYSEALMREVVNRGSLREIPGLSEEVKEVFKTSHEIPFEWHVRHQAAFQKFTDNGVSKTINLPHDASEADIANAYLLAWELGCLGITIFRDGCKGDQVLNVGVKGLKDESAASAFAPSGAIGPAIIKPRPHSLTGSTYRMQTPIGTAFITINETPDGEPFEVFVQVGKGGSDTMAVAEALGRLISLCLRLPSPFSAKRRLEEVINQLSRIGGGQPTGFGASRILSLPDALARTLAEHVGQVRAEAAAVDMPTGKTRVGDLCKECGQATFIYEEGCKKCLSCGFNEC